jgi:hypothetical protein
MPALSLTPYLTVGLLMVTQAKASASICTNPLVTVQVGASLVDAIGSEACAHAGPAIGVVDRVR